MKKRGFFLCAHDYGHRDDERIITPELNFAKRTAASWKKKLARLLSFPE